MSELHKVELESAYVLHQRAYRESSSLLEVLAENHGRVGLVARGARGQRPRWRGVLQPFQPVRLSWSGRGSLFNLRHAESIVHWQIPTGDSLLSAYYVNELVMSLTTRGDPHPELFAHYAAAMADLTGDGSPHLPLRRFELALLTELGYGLNLATEYSDSGLDPGADYEYVPDQGPVPAGRGGGGPVLRGDELVRIAAGDFSTPKLLELSRGLFKALISYQLGDRRLRTREVFNDMRRPTA